MHYRNRMYQPGMGRFLSRDPIGYGGDQLNLYQYANGSPLCFADPSGALAWVPIACCTCGATLAIKFGTPIAVCFWYALDYRDARRGYIVGYPPRRVYGWDAVNASFADCLSEYYKMATRAHDVATTIVALSSCTACGVGSVLKYLPASGAIGTTAVDVANLGAGTWLRSWSGEGFIMRASIKSHGRQQEEAKCRNTGW